MLLEPGFAGCGRPASIQLQTPQAYYSRNLDYVGRLCFLSGSADVSPKVEAQKPACLMRIEGIPASGEEGRPRYAAELSEVWERSAKAAEKNKTEEMPETVSHFYSIICGATYL